MAALKRNRAERRAATVYEVIPVFVDPEGGNVLECGVPHSLEGELHDHVLVTVPPTTTVGSSKLLQQALMAELGKPVLVLTNNTRFVRVREMGSTEGATIIKEAEANDAKALDAIDYADVPPEN